MHGSSDPHIPWPFSGEASGEGGVQRQTPEPVGMAGLGSRGGAGQTLADTGAGENISACEYDRQSPAAGAGAG